MHYFRRLLTVSFLLATFASQAQMARPDPHYTFFSGANAVQDRNFYLFTLIEKMPAVRKVIVQDAYLQNISKSFSEHLAGPVHADVKDANGLVRPFLFSNEEVAGIGYRLNELLQQEQTAMSPLIHTMRNSGLFQLYNRMSDTALLTQAWQDAAKGVNYIIDAYTKGKGFRYPNIDSAAYWVKSPDYYASVNSVLDKLQSEDLKTNLFFEPSLDLALALLSLNRHDEAGRYEPMSNLNQSAYATIKSIHWKKFAYTAILILGAGPGNKSNISDAGKLRCKSGVAAYKQGLAPFIIVSGGHVHPFLTPFAEALEMKKYLVDSLGMPDNAVIAEPYARHTTTNIRNANRLIYRSGMPVDKRVLCVSDNMHLTYISTRLFELRCRQELGYLPMIKPQNVSETSISYLPDLNSLQADSRDPLDP
ncbi:YdcF family protein [Chitinophaga sp. sic0106]|uniref:YdcF family protein n=1 Tax=Chitinophaga sp. sic0106 TaxID=2854785 RepID=UPI001C47D5EB|nr:YdcF family protein [Chitinophaga sp. sic0106]MBV7530560.1 YdcF family protein [Chitinophaga sp. sic0106]